MSDQLEIELERALTLDPVRGCELFRRHRILEDNVDGWVDEIVPWLREHGLVGLEMNVRHHALKRRLDAYDMRGDTLQAALDLLERSRLPDAAGGPHSACAAVDVCAAYAILDAPGYAAERLRVVDEDPERIHRSSTSWSTLPWQRVRALQDLGRHTEALRLAEEAEARPDGGRDISFSILRADSLLALERPAKALGVVESWDGSDYIAYTRLVHAMQTFRVRIALGRFAEALAAAPAWTEVAGRIPLYPRLLDCWRAAIASGAMTWDLPTTTRVSEMLRTLSDHQVHRGTVDAAVSWASLALDEHRTDLARVLLELAERHLPRLAAPLGADVRCAEARARLETSLPAPCTRERPLPVEQSLVVAERWLARGWPERARPVLEAALEQAPLDPRLLDLRFRCFTEAADHAGLAAAIAELPGDAPASVELLRRWYRGLARYHQGDRVGAVDDAAWMWHHHRAACRDEVHEHLVEWLEESGDLDRALRILDQVAELGRADREIHAQRMILAALYQRWDKVDEIASSVGLAWDAQPILVKTDFHGPMLAERTGPCTAVVLDITGPNQLEFFGSTWVIEPNEEPTQHLLDLYPERVYRGLGVLEHSVARGWEVYGTVLSEAQLERIDRYARAHGGKAYRTVLPYEGPGMYSPDNDEYFPAERVQVALVEEGSEAGLAELLTRIAAEHERPLMWPELLVFLDDFEGAWRQRDVAGHWDM